ncbi:hypothetical protein WMY93_029334 [Mugilogobius chulae]|uniref:Upstream stimulatory factor 1 n=1 Tax=Mugilogobius chulae TaxID=88201 RepID=A0AAW0MRY4_9GOBI
MRAPPSSRWCSSVVTSIVILSEYTTSSLRGIDPGRCPLESARNRETVPNIRHDDTAAPVCSSLRCSSKQLPFPANAANGSLPPIEATGNQTLNNLLSLALKQGDFGTLRACTRNNSLRLECFYANCTGSPSYSCHISSSDVTPRVSTNMCKVTIKNHKSKYVNISTHFNCTLIRRKRVERRNVTVDYSIKKGKLRIKPCQGGACSVQQPVVVICLWPSVILIWIFLVKQNLNVKMMHFESVCLGACAHRPRRYSVDKSRGRDHCGSGLWRKSVSLSATEMKSQQKSPEPDGSITVSEEGSVATAEDPAAIATIQSAATFTDQPIKYLFKTEGAGGQVTYRVIQVSDGQLEAQADGAAAVSLVAGFPATSQAVTQGDGGAETQYTYYPATIADAATGTMVTTVQAADTLLGQSTPAGQLYVMMSPQEVLTGANPRSIAPRTQPYLAKQDAPRGSRDDKRRAQHNEVERRRRDKINNWIVQLSKTIPDCNVDYTKTGQSKGGILSKACEYIKELRQSNIKLGEDISTLDRLRIDNQLLRQEVEDWKSKNQILRNLLRQHGIVGSSSTDPQ